MNTERFCGCKSYRTCLLCENEYKITSKTKNFNQEYGTTYVYCPYCNKAWPGWDLNDYKTHPNHNGQSLEYPGVFIDLNFLTADEESELIQGIDREPWDLSQSGRRKQNYGPKCNFKKHKLKLGEFQGFPRFTKFVQDKFSTKVPILKGFQTIEQCSLEYDSKRGASIDPHVDDCWIWGERIVTVNLLSDSVLTMNFNEDSGRYNLGDVSSYPSVIKQEVGSNWEFNLSDKCYEIKKFKEDSIYPIVRIPMPRRSLLVIYGSARYDWAHRVLREDIKGRRVCLAYREFTPPYLPGGDKYEEGLEILDKAKEFWD